MFWVIVFSIIFLLAIVSGFGLGYSVARYKRFKRIFPSIIIINTVTKTVKFDKFMPPECNIIVQYELCHNQRTENKNE